MSGKQARYYSRILKNIKLQLERLKNIVRIGVITTEKKEGPFSLEIDYIEFLE
jgi:hypothetical protein